MNHRKWLKVSFLILTVVFLSAAHFAVGRLTHRQHVVHVILRETYLVPIIASAVWLGLRGSVATSAVISLLYYLHIRLSWPDQPMENANQLAVIGVYLVLGTVAGILVNLQERERSRRREAERRKQREGIIQGIAGLCNALGFRDEHTREHSESVARLAVEIGKRRGLRSDRLDLLRLAGLLHDIGKIGVRDDVLFKPDELTMDERVAMERHPVVAAEILKPIRGTEEIAEIVLAHHECPDGSGYPLGLTSEQIPVEAHILRVADVFSSLMEKRPYKSAMDPDEAMAVIDEMTGSQLDPESVQALQSGVNEQPVVKEGP
ncbi:MAG: HD domain-containing phosphohydrolase [Acidobacteriota bacterium]